MFNGFRLIKQKKKKHRAHFEHGAFLFIFLLY